MKIGLIGFQGAGKTQLAKRLSAAFSFDYVDTDELVELEYNQALNCRQIFQKKGEQFFRQLERRILMNFKGKPDQIISFGGGCPLNLVKEISDVSVYLHLGLDEAYFRMQLKGGVFVLEPFKGFYARREKAYTNCADIIVSALGSRVFYDLKDILKGLINGE